MTIPQKNIHKVAVIQMASGPNVSTNLMDAGNWLSQAASEGAEIAVLPENFAFMGHHEQDKLAVGETNGTGPIQDFLAETAQKHQMWIVGGTLPILTDRADKIAAACLVFDQNGQRVARFDKIHLFDVKLPASQETYAESATILAGNHPTVVDTPVGPMGLAVCYDLRFPELFRQMASSGLVLAAIPSAFTATTGRAHWEILNRARAIENLCYVAASAQGGHHINGRETWGHSMIVDPWGTVIAEKKRGSGCIIGNLDLEYLRNIRTRFPCLEHRKLQDVG